MGTDARRRRRGWAAAVVVAVAVVVWLWRGSDRARIGAVLDDVSAVLTESGSDPEVARRERLRRAFGRAFTPDARVSAPDLTATGVGPEAFAATAEGVMQGFDSTRVHLGPPTIQVAGSGREASAQLQVVASASGPDVGTVSDVREARVELRKTDAGWRIVSVTLTARSRDEPEARP